jgi:hypothetical protein
VGQTRPTGPGNRENAGREDQSLSQSVTRSSNFQSLSGKAKSHLPSIAYKVQPSSPPPAWRGVGCPSAGESCELFVGHWVAIGDTLTRLCLCIWPRDGPGQTQQHGAQQTAPILVCLLSLIILLYPGTDWIYPDLNDFYPLLTTRQAHKQSEQRQLYGGPRTPFWQCSAAVY